ncbi:IMPACT family protein [Actinomyces vulturis]|uniref:IMPACT family protein n=1 Tax=Actinomyces vulturis TaxID=1857645 RepID=UPI00082BAF7B|nr:YigZ family protein [Actinomyces vulturis]
MTDSQSPGLNDLTTGAGTITISPGEEREVDIEIKKSHFLGYATHVTTEDDAREVIARRRQTYPDARHHCSAFVIRSSGALPISRSSDDGEPSGTAGMPMLRAIEGENLTDVCVVVTRYFGGVLLGTGGLVRAYTQATQETLAVCPLVKREVWYLFQCHLQAAIAGVVSAQLHSAGVRVDDINWAVDGATFTIAHPSADPTDLHAQLSEMARQDVELQSQGFRVVNVPC